MISSMTGFGSGGAESEKEQVKVVLRSVNSRFCDIQVRSPALLQEFEPAIRERLQSRIGRGKITVNIDREEKRAEAMLPELDEEVARRYLAELERLRALGGSKGKIDLSVVAGLPGVFKAGVSASAGEDIKEVLLRALDQAIDEFARMRQAEGQALEADLRTRVGLIDERLERIGAQASGATERLRTQLREKVAALLRPGEVDEERLALEVVLLAERSDIAEEIVRFRSHNVQFLAALDQGGEVGRRLNFLLQEMNREANTISSKATETAVIHWAVEIKEEVERLREQVQNLA